MFKRGVKLIPLESRPPVSARVNASHRTELTIVRLKIHIDLLPWMNSILVSPYGVVIMTLSVLPLARLVYTMGSSVAVRVRASA